ncbi:MAG: hypothetical protein KGP10_01575 [Actinomycetales bacterium]|nr:hypothetical protein [Actinomycetales bacterium]
MTMLWQGLDNVVLVLHFLGLAALIGGWLVAVRTRPRAVSNAMWHGVLTQLVTGIILVGLAETVLDDGPVDHAKVGVKLLLTLVIAVLVFLGRRRAKAGAPLPGVAFLTIGVLSIVNVILAVFW